MLEGRNESEIRLVRNGKEEKKWVEQLFVLLFAVEITCHGSDSSS